MRVPGNAGRFFAVFVAAPLLVVFAAMLLMRPSTTNVVAVGLLVFSAIFVAYELLWIFGLLTYK